MPAPRIAPLAASPAVLDALTAILVDTVARGGSVGFMDPLDPSVAMAFWQRALAAAVRQERVVLGAWDEARLIGTVTLLLDCPENQPHRGEIAKLMVAFDHRGQGIAGRLIRAAEALAVTRGRTLLVLDTASEGGARRLYEGLGFTLAGEIPGYALKPQGGLTGTLVYWKRIADAVA